MEVVLRSQRGEMGRESCFSRSPCWKNSSIILAVHLVWISHGFAGLEISAECRRKHRAFERCSSVNSITLWKIQIETIPNMSWLTIMLHKLLFSKPRDFWTTTWLRLTHLGLKGGTSSRWGDQNGRTCLWQRPCQSLVPWLESNLQSWGLVEY